MSLKKWLKFQESDITIRKGHAKKVKEIQKRHKPPIKTLKSIQRYKNIKKRVTQ